MSRLKGHGWLLTTKKPAETIVRVFSPRQFGRPPDYTPGIPDAGESTVIFIQSERDLYEDIMDFRVGVIDMDAADPEVLRPLLNAAVWAASSATEVWRQYRVAKRTAQSHLRAAAKVLGSIAHPFSPGLD